MLAALTRRALGWVTAAATVVVAWPGSAQAVSFNSATYTVPPYGGQHLVQPESLAVADFNRDGKPDIAVLDVPGTAPGDEAVDLFLNTGKGRFHTPPKQFSTGCPAGGNPRDLIASDFNGDGKPDLLLLCGSGYGILLPGDGKGGFGNPVYEYQVGANAQLTVGDFDADGSPDLEYLGPYQSGNDFCFLDDPNLLGSSGSESCSGPAPSTPYDPYALASGKFGSGGSARQLALAFSEATGKQTLHFFGITPSNTCCSQSDRAVGPGFSTSISIGDLNGDHNADIVMGSNIKAGAGSISVYLWNPSKGIPATAKPVSYSSPVGVWRTGLADFNHDGHLDVAAAGHDGVAIHLGTGKGTFKTPQKFALPAGFNSADGLGNLLAVRDLNGDGKPDMVVLVNTGITVFLNTTHLP